MGVVWVEFREGAVFGTAHRVSIVHGFVGGGIERGGSASPRVRCCVVLVRHVWRRRLPGQPLLRRCLRSGTFIPWHGLGHSDRRRSRSEVTVRDVSDEAVVNLRSPYYPGVTTGWRIVVKREELGSRVRA